MLPLNCSVLVCNIVLLIDCSGNRSITPASQLQVRLGAILAKDPDPDAVYANVSHVIPHPNYAPFRLYQNDVALLRLTSPITYTDTILPICLPSPNVNLDQFKVCVQTGFGRTSKYGLSYTHLGYTKAGNVRLVQFVYLYSFFVNYTSGIFQDVFVPIRIC